jgi:hypothetical protein
MANPEHLAVLKQGVERWNKWREAHPDVEPDLSRSGLEKVNLGEANLRGANLSKANLHGSDLSWANLTGANLSQTNLRQGTLPSQLSHSVSVNEGAEPSKLLALCARVT